MPPITATLAEGRTLTLDNGKCIACGKCVALGQEAGERYGPGLDQPRLCRPPWPRPRRRLAAALERSAEACVGPAPPPP